MEEINLDLNNLFNLSYSFEGLKILLTSIAKNQDIMLQKIKQLENNQKLNEKNNIKFIPQKIVETKKVEDKNHANENKEAMNTNSDKDKDIYNNFLISDLTNRISNLEDQYRNIRSFIPQYQEQDPRTLNDILDEHKSNLNDLNENIKGINNNISNMKESMENMQLKVMDFSIFEVFKDKNITADVDVAELLIKALENKMNEKFKFNDEKIKKDEQDIMKLKTELTNIKNSSNFQTKNLSYIKEEILSIQKNIEQLRTNTSDNIMKNKELIRKLREKNNASSKEFSESMSSINIKINSFEEKINKLLEEFENIKKEKNMESSNLEQENVKHEDFIIFQDNIQKKCTHLEKKLQILSESIKTKELEEKIYQLNRELQNKKPSDQEYFSLNEQVQSHQDLFDNIKIDNINTQNDLKKIKESMNLINRKCEDLILQNLMSAKTPDDLKDGKVQKNLILSKMKDYLESSVFNEYLIDDTREKEKIKKDIDNYKQFKEEIIETLKKSASIQDLKNLEAYLEDLFDEYKEKMAKLCPKKSEINKALKSLELQIKSLYELILKKDEKSDNWLIAKKPIGGYACASCDNYIGDLKENDEKVFWNQFPEYTNYTIKDIKELNVNKIGNGFSRILNLVNINKEINENDKGIKILNNEWKNGFKENNEKENNNIFNQTGYKKNKKAIYRNINIETNLKTVPSYDEAMNGFKTQRLKNINIDEIKLKNNDINNNLPTITSRNDKNNIIDIYEEGKEQKDGPKLIKIIKKKK